MANPKRIEPPLARNSALTQCGGTPPWEGPGHHKDNTGAWPLQRTFRIGRCEDARPQINEVARYSFVHRSIHPYNFFRYLSNYISISKYIRIYIYINHKHILKVSKTYVYVCMYVCMYVHMYVSMYVCM